MRVLLTGAAGFVGSHVLQRLVEDPRVDKVVCPVTFQHRGWPDRIRLVLEEVTQDDKIKILYHDLTAPVSPVTDEEFGRIDVVINVASESHVDRSIEEPTPFILNNVSLLCHLLDWARSRQDRELYAPKVIIQVSTDEVYGPAEEGFDHQEWKHGHLPSNPYAASKAAQEDIAFSYWRTYDLPIVITNTMNIIGQMQHPEKFFPQVIKRVRDGQEVIIHGSPKGTPGSRFYLHASNQADGIFHVVDWVTAAPGTKKLPYTQESLRYSDGGTKPYRFHIVGEREVNNLEMAERIAAVVGKPLKYKLTDFHSSRPGHDLRYALDGSKMKAIGWKPPVPLDESIQNTVEWTLRHPEWLKE